MGHQTRLDDRALSLMVVSHSCLEEVNRSVYRFLHREHQIPVHLVIPRFNDVGEGFRLCGSVEQEPVHCSVLEPKGRHLRLRRLEGLPQLIRAAKPSHVLVESDPATLMVLEVLWATRGTSTQVWSLTAENRTRNFLSEAWQASCAFRWKTAIGSLMGEMFSRLARRGLSRVFTVSRQGTLAFEKNGYPNRVTQVPLGFDPTLFIRQPKKKVQATRARLGLTQRTIGYFGRLSHEKGVDILIDALARLKDFRWQLLIDDFTHQQSDFVFRLRQRIREFGLEGRVVFFGANHADMPDYMNACDLAVLPSRRWNGWEEQYGRVVPEAMACGKLVIGSSSGAIPELLGDPHFIFQQGSVQDLTRILKEVLLLTEEQLYELGTHAQERAMKSLSLTTQAEIFGKYLKADESHWKSTRERDALGMLRDTTPPGV